MAIGSGLSAQLGIAAESTYGTLVTPDHFLPFRSQNLKAMVEAVTGDDLLGYGLFPSADQVRTYISGAGGDTEVNVLNKGIGLNLKAILGSVATTQPDAINSPTVYLHTFTPSATGNAGQFYTVQAGVPMTAGTVEPFNFISGKVTAWELACEVGQAVTLKQTWDFKTAEHTTALAALSLPSAAKSLIFVDGTITVGGVTQKVKKFSLAGAWAMDTDRRYIGNVKAEPIANDVWAITGALDQEFAGYTIYDAWVAGSTAAMVATFSYGDIEDSLPYKLIVTAAAIRYTGDAPEVSGPGVVQQAAPFEVRDNGTDPALKFEYQTTDATP